MLAVGCISKAMLLLCSLYIVKELIFSAVLLPILNYINFSNTNGVKSDSFSKFTSQVARIKMKLLYAVTGSIGTDDITAHVILDKKNNSIHIHFFGKIFGDTKKPILVKHSNSKFPEDGGVDLVKQIVMGEFTNKKIQIKRVIAMKETTIEQAKPTQRTIIRFKK